MALHQPVVLPRHHQTSRAIFCVKHAKPVCPMPITKKKLWRLWRVSHKTFFATRSFNYAFKKNFRAASKRETVVGNQIRQYYNGQYLIRYLFCSKQVQKVCYVPFAWSCSQFRNLMRLSFFEIWQNDFRHALNMIIHVKTFASVIRVWKSTAD